MLLVVNYLSHEPASTLVKEYDVHLRSLRWCSVTKVMIPSLQEVEVQMHDDEGDNDDLLDLKN
jgi:hypothetical protein